MFNESEIQGIDVDISSGMLEELTLRANSMGLTASEYAGCVMGQHVESQTGSGGIEP